MAFIVTNEGERESLNRITAKNPAPAEFTLRLFKNNITPSESSVFTDFVEPTDSLYGVIPLVGAEWEVSTVDGVTQAIQTEKTFDFAAGETIYGYFITTLSGADEVVFLAERFPTPDVILAGGGSVSVTPTMQLE